MSDSRTHTPTPDYANCLRSLAKNSRRRGAVLTADEMDRVADHLVALTASHDGLVEALRAITEAAGNYCQAIDDIGTSGEPPEEHVDRLDALEECIRDALVVSRRALEAAGITEMDR